MVVGSDRDAVAGALTGAERATVDVSLRRESGALIAELGEMPVPATGLLVAYDPKRVTAIGAGENGGRHLTEYNIVREATALGTWNGAARRVALPSVAADRGVALLVQGKDLRVVGAAKLGPRADTPG